MRPFTNKELNKLIIPLVLEQTLGVTVGILNTIMVAGAGEAAVAGVSLVETINILLVNIFASLSTGGAVVAARYIGQKNEDEACRTANQLLLSVTVISLFVMSVALVGSRNLLSLLYGNIEPDVLNHATAYFYFTALSFPALAIYNSSAAICRSMGKTNITLNVSVLINVITFCGNLILINIYNMGAAGAGISTLISRITGAVVMLVVVHNQSRPIHYDAKFKLGYVPGIIKEILHIGIPTVVDASVFQVGKLLVQGLVASFGTASIAANAVIGSVSGFALIPSAAIGLALLTVVGQTMGTRVYEDVKYYVKKLLKSTYISMIILNIVIIVFSKQIAGLYNLSPEAYEMSWKIIIYHGFAAMSVYPLAFALPNALRAADDAKFTMIVSIFSMWVWRIGFSYILSNNLGLGLYGIWFAMFIDWIFRGICFLLRQLSGKWMN